MNKENYIDEIKKIIKETFPQGNNLNYVDYLYDFDEVVLDGYFDLQILAEHINYIIKQKLQQAITQERERQYWKYNELINAVETMHKGETRHQTALRYIQEAEQSKNNEATTCPYYSGN